MKRPATIALCLALLLLISISWAATRVVFVASQVSALIVLNDFSLSNTDVPQGQSTSFSVTFENTGTASTTATASVRIYDSSNNLVDTVTYSATSITPNQQVVQITSWDSGSRPVGAYTAIARVSYLPYGGGGDTNSNEITRAFNIVAGGGGRGGGGGLNEEFNPFAPILPTTPITLPPTLTPVSGGPVEFTKFPVLKEVLAGQSAIQSLQFVNEFSLPQTLQLDVLGIDPSWFSLGSRETQVLAGETRTTDLAISVPRSATVGDYLVRIDAKNDVGTSSDFLVVRVVGTASENPVPYVLKTIELDRKKGETTVNLAIRNPTSKTIENMELEEVLPEEFQNAQVTFLDKPGEIQIRNGVRRLVWILPELLPNEEARISYSINLALTQYSPYINEQRYQLQVSTREDLSNVLQILDLKASALDSDGNAQVVATVLYVGEEPLEATMTLEAPVGVAVYPNYLTATLQPRSTFTVRFNLKASEELSESQLLRFLAFTDEGQVSARIPLVLGGQPAAPPPAAGLIRVTSTDAAILGVLGVFFIIGFLVYNGRGGGRGAKFDPERLEYAKTIARTIKPKE